MMNNILKKLFAGIMVVCTLLCNVDIGAIAAVMDLHESGSGGELAAYCGESIDLSDYVDDEFVKSHGDKWQWKMYAGDKEIYSGPVSGVNKNLISLGDNNIKAGEYELRCCGSSMASGDNNPVCGQPVKLTVSRLPLFFDLENWVVDEKKSYDATSLFYFEEAPSSIPEGAEALDYYKSMGVKLLISAAACDGEKAVSNAGQYQELIVKSVSLKHPEYKDFFDMTEIQSLIDVKKTEEVSLDISPIKIRCDSFPVLLEYRTNKISVSSMYPLVKDCCHEFTLDSGNPVQDFFLTEELFKLLVDRLDKKTVDKAAHLVSFENMAFDQIGRGRVFLSENAEFIFDGNCFSDTEPDCFHYEYVNEDLHDMSIPQYLDFRDLEDNFLYEVDGRDYSYWCSDRRVIISYTGLGLEPFDSGAYDYMVYKRLPALAQLMKNDIYNTYVSFSGCREGFDIDTDNERLYLMLFGKEDTDNLAAAAIIHVVPENMSCECPEEISGYPVITLYIDTTAPEVIFKGEELNRSEDLIRDKRVQMDEVVRNDTVEFTVSDDCAEVTDIRYAFITTERDEGYDSATHTYKLPEDTIDEALFNVLAVNAEGRYEIKTPENMLSGDVILYVRTKNKSLASGEYISNAMMVDKAAPTVDISFMKQDGTDITSDVLKGEGAYINQNISVSIRLQEDHYDSSVIKITKTNLKGEQLGETQSLELEETGNYNVMSKDISLWENGNYRIEISAVDKAGNSVSDGNGQPLIYYITVDKDKPSYGNIEIEGSLHNIENGGEGGLLKMVFSAFKMSWNTLVKGIKYNVFGEGVIDYVMTGEDEISPVEISYYISNNEMSEDGLIALEENKWIRYDEEKGGKIEVNTSGILYERVVDKAGNKAYFGTEGVITDNIKPEVNLSITMPNKKGFYKGDVRFDVIAEDKTITGETKAAGLQYVAYRIEKNGKLERFEVLYDKSNGKEAGQDTYSFGGIIYAKDYNSNDVVLYVTAIDNSGNITEEKRELKIDNVKPVITVSYNDNPGGKYYNHERTATVTIRERNLEQNDIRLSVRGKNGALADIGKWKCSDSTGQSDAATYTCRIVFSKDDDYELSVVCTDKAGNRAEKGFSDKFTVDVKKPVIKVEYEGGEPKQDGYYSESVTAVIRIFEHNFNEKKVVVRIGGENDEQTVVPDFKSNGDEHTATILFDKDGSYRLQVSCEDKAGNRALDYKGNSFVIDLCKPEIEITNIQDKSANKGEVKPIITCSDLNYTADGASFMLYGANNGEINLETISYRVIPIKGGQQFVMDFPKAKELDDLYTLTVKVRDKAGNETDKSIEFSVNRFGSVYTLGGGTKEWLAPGECAYIKEGRQVVIVETNVDEIASSNIAYSCGGVNSSVVTIADVNECCEEDRGHGHYYEVKDNSRKEVWHQYEYVINQNNFFEEGRYEVQIDTVDKAGNHTSNISNKQEEGSLDIEFVVDHTAPDAVITGAEPGGIYNEEEHTLYVDAQDNMALDSVIVLVDGSEYGTYSAEEIEGLEDGLIPVRLGQSISMQTVQIRAKDKAGNLLGGKTEGSCDKTFEDFRILVTTNIFVRLLHSVWVLIITAATGGGLIIIICRRRRIGKTA